MTAQLSIAGGCCVAGSLAALADALQTHRLYAVEGVKDGRQILTVERIANALPQVAKARLNLSDRRLEVELAETGHLPDQALATALAPLGLTLRPYEPDEAAKALDTEGKALIRCMAVAGFAAMNVMLLSISVWAGHVSGMSSVTRDFMHWVSALIALPAIAYAAQPFFRGALAGLKAGQMGMDLPIALAVILATGMSLWQTAQSGLHAWFDAALMLLFFLLVGRVLDHALRRRTFARAHNLLALQRLDVQRLRADGSVETIAASELAAGDRIQIAAGERVGADGRVVEGASEVDMSVVTGESLPVDAAPGTTLYAGVMNLNGPLTVEVTAAGASTLLAELTRLMEDAGQSRARYIRLADRAAQLYSPIVHAIAAIAFFGWWLIGGIGWEDSLKIAIATLIITCPCALGLAVPAVQVTISGALFRRRVLIKSGDALERLAEVDTVVFDKTGTLTLDRPQLVGGADHPALPQAARLATLSRHPLAKALVEAAHINKIKGITPLPPDCVTDHPGAGLSATVDGANWTLGSARFVGVEAQEDGLSELWFKMADDMPPIRFSFRQALRPEAAKTVQQLKDAGLRLLILSGDRPAAVRPVAEALEIEDWQGGLSPADKLSHLSELSRLGHKTAMVGDGLNDAAALAAAHVSISPASGAELSQTAADFVFQGDALSPVALAHTASRTTRDLILGNFALAVVYNLIAIPIALTGHCTPLIAAIAMSGSSLVVMANALRGRKLDGKLSADPSRDPTPETGGASA
ncbi:MAG: heavy metal translocating P-type ATPase metal-binding domain-containing protein [Alphaproteobacteria bacterium]